MRNDHFAAIAILSMMSALPAQAETIRITTTKDNTLYETAAGNLSNGSGDHLFSGRTSFIGGASIHRGLIAFDIASNIPAGSSIDSAEVTLYLSRTNFAASQPIALQRVLSDWGEGASNALGEEGMGASALPGDATWLHTFFNAEFWATAGGDFSSIISAVTNVAARECVPSGNVCTNTDLTCPPGEVCGDTPYTWGPTPGMAADVQLWLDDPGTNAGWVIVGNEFEPATSKRFNTREHPNAEARPVLTIEFTPPALPGDLDGNGQVDLQDHKTMADCLTGPAVLCNAVCCAGDLDESGSVDLMDAAVLFRNFTGSE